MPTAGEAGLAQSEKKTSRERDCLRSKPFTNKVAQTKSKLAQCPHYVKSSIPVPVKKCAKKENSDPNIAAAAAAVGKRPSKVKRAPNFSKIHKKWESQLSKGKAVSKKKNTTVETFKLTKSGQQSHEFKKPYAYNSEDEDDAAATDGEDDFVIDSTALKGILSNTGIQDEDLRINGRATISTVPSSESSVSGQSAGIRTSIYYTRPSTLRDVAASRNVPKSCVTHTSRLPLSPLKPCNVDNTSGISEPGSCIKKQVAWADQAPEKDSFDFQPDSKSLESILSNTGISDNLMRLQNTSRVTLSGGRLTPYRRGRQAFREEPRTSIYYTGPKRTRPSPRGSVFGRSSGITRTRQATQDAQKYNAYNPFTTIVGAQGQLKPGDNDPIFSFAVRQFSASDHVPDSQPFNSIPLSTPSRIVASRVQPSATRDEPTWADILTPQRGAIIQEQGARSQAFPEPLHTPGKQQPFDKELCTPQRVTFVSQNCSVPRDSINVSSLAALARGATPQNPTVITRRASTTQSVDLMSKQAWHPQPSSTTALHSEYSHTQTPSFPSSVETLSTPARPSPCLSKPLSSFQRQPDICTPLTQVDGSRLQLSTVQITSFQPSAKAEGSSSTEARLPHRTVEQQETTCTKAEENDVMVELERQAKEDLGLLYISDREVSCEKSTPFHDNADDVFCSNVSESLDNRCDSAFKKPQVCSRPLPSFSSQDPALNTRKEHLSSYNLTSTSLENDSSFCPPVRLVYPTPVKGSRTASTVCDTPYSAGFLPTGSHQVNSTAMRTNSLSLRSALSSSNPQGLQPKNPTLPRTADGICSRVRWEEVSAADDLMSAFRAASAPFRKTSKFKAQEALLDMEVSSYLATSHNYMFASLEQPRRPMNPLARQFLEGGSMHFQPINSR